MILDKMIGRTISHYKVTRKLGEGGMGVVYQAEDLKLHRTVALKFLRSEALEGEEQRIRFLREAQAVAALNHPNICTVHEIDEANGHSFIVMEFIEGESVRQKVQARPLKLDEALDITIQAAQGLQEAHEKGITHRDIKSANIMATGKGQVKLMDFGLAQLGDRSQLTKTGSTLGTPAYMSPEQALGEKTDHRSDIWSLGVVLYEMVAGQLPFRGEVEAAVTYSIVNQDPEPLTALRAGVPIELDRVVSTALAKKRDERYQHVDELLVDLRALRGGKGQQQPISAPRGMASFRKVSIAIVAACVGILAAGALFVQQRQPLPSAQEALLEVQRLAHDENYFAAYRLARRVEDELGKGSALEPLWADFSREIDVETAPPGAELSIAPYSDSQAESVRLGRTPLSRLRIPLGVLRWRIEKPGSPLVERVGRVDRPSWSFKSTEAEGGRTVITIEVPPDSPERAEMVRVLGREVRIRMTGLRTPPPVGIGDFWIDRYEVTNREFKSFVETRGYRNSTYWKYPFIRGGKAIPREDALAEFVDATGSPGPSVWEFGDYPAGDDDLPVGGVSWYEAAAYAEFAGKELPTIFHWARATGLYFGSLAVPLSNFGGSGPEPVGNHKGISDFGAYDMYGNVREWCWNPTTANGEFRYLLGAAWDEPAYRAGGGNARSAFDRSARNGFRLANGLVGQETAPAAFEPVEHAFRDYSKLEPVSDEVFSLYAGLYEYGPGDLSATVEEVEDESEYWRHERVELNAAYDGERMPLHLFLPKGESPPHQVVIFFPGADAFRGLPGPELSGMSYVEAVVRSGRTVAYPVYEGSYERSEGVNPDLYQPNSGTEWRDHVIKCSKDLGRVIDYIETREDLDQQKLGYLGVSRGTVMGAVLPAVEKRLKVAVLVSGGLVQADVRPEADLINFCPRITIPVLMVNGKYDFVFPVDTAQRPMFELLGAAREHKKHVILEGGHMPPRNDVVREVFAWLDRYLGVTGQEKGSR